MIRLSNSACMFVLIVASCSAQAIAQSVPMFNVQPQLHALGHANGTIVLGWTFYVRSSIILTHVGWYDTNGDGLSHAHRVGLWRDRTGATTWPYFGASSSEIFRLYTPDVSEQVTIPSGTNAELFGVWRRIEIPGGPIVLAPGGYALGGLDHPDSTDHIRYIQFGDAEPPLSSGVKFVAGAPAAAQIAGFVPPSLFPLVRGIYVGPMLFFQVPEPGAASLVASGMMLIGAVRQHFRKVKVIAC